MCQGVENIGRYEASPGTEVDPIPFFSNDIADAYLILGNLKYHDWLPDRECFVACHARSTKDDGSAGHHFRKLLRIPEDADVLLSIRAP